MSVGIQVRKVNYQNSIMKLWQPTELLPFLAAYSILLGYSQHQKLTSLRLFYLFEQTSGHHKVGHTEWTHVEICTLEKVPRKTMGR